MTCSQYVRPICFPALARRSTDLPHEYPLRVALPCNARRSRIHAPERFALHRISDPAETQRARIAIFVANVPGVSRSRTRTPDSGRTPPGMIFYRAFAPAPLSPALQASSNGNCARSRGSWLTPLAMRPGAVVGLPGATGSNPPHLPQAPPPPALPSCPQQTSLWTTLAASGSCDSWESRPSVRSRGFVETATRVVRRASPEPARFSRRPAARSRSTPPDRPALSVAAPRYAKLRRRSYRDALT